jgi:hemolysin activation/secretion protein
MAGRCFTHSNFLMTTIMIKQPKRLALIFASLGLSTAVFAQTPPPYNAGSALKDAQPVQPQAPRKAPEPVIIQSEEKPLALPAGQTLTINAFRFEGADFIPEAELQAALASFKGQALSMIDIEAAAGRITALYRERGYLVARAYVPKQDASGGTLTIRVLVGHYGKVSIKNQSLVRDAVVEPYFAPLSGESAVARADLERAMLLVSDLPGATMPRLTISPGEAPGTSDFDVDVGAGKRVAAYLYEDNYGSRYTGRNRFNVGADFNSPTAHGDRLSLSGMASETGGLLNGRVAYSLPLASNGLKGEVAYSKTTYELGNTYKDLDATGYADTLEATFSLPLQRGREENLTAAFNLAARQMHDELRAAGTTTPKHAEVATVSLAYERYTRLFGRDAYLSASGGVSYGHLSISDRDEEDLNQAGADTVGQYGKASAVLAARLALAERLSLSTSLTLQQALFGKNLDSSEQLMISGTRGVMAFEQSASGDNGFLFNTELRYALPSVAGIEHSVAIFADSGYVRLENPAYTTVQSTYLADAGIGYSLTYKQLFARAQFASSVSKTPAAVNGGSDNRFLFQAGAFF